MTTILLDRATDPSSAAVTPAGTTPLAGVVLPADYDFGREYFPNAAPLPVREVRFTRPPAGAETLAAVVQRIAE